MRVRPRGFYKTGLSFGVSLALDLAPPGAPHAIQLMHKGALFALALCVAPFPKCCFFCFCISRGFLGLFLSGCVLDRAKGKTGFLCPLAWLFPPFPSFVLPVPKRRTPFPFWRLAGVFFVFVLVSCLGAFLSLYFSQLCK